MNRIILIGNGFDKAHGLATCYQDFIGHYWDNVYESITQGALLQNYQDDMFGCIVGQHIPNSTSSGLSFSGAQSCKDFLQRLDDTLAVCSKKIGVSIRSIAEFKNDFFKHICEKSSLNNWVDIENEYYHFLCRASSREDAKVREEEITKLNYYALKVHRFEEE